MYGVAALILLVKFPEISTGTCGLFGYVSTCPTTGLTCPVYVLSFLSHMIATATLNKTGKIHSFHILYVLK